MRDRYNFILLFCFSLFLSFMEADSPLQSWQWGLIAFGIILFIISITVIIWAIKRSSNNTASNDEENKSDAETISPASIKINESISITTNKGNQEQQQGGLYEEGRGQQFTEVVTALSPPKRDRKESNNATAVPLTTLTEKVQQDEEEEEQELDLGNMRGLFSLSPAAYEQASNNSTPHSSINLNSLNGSNHSRTNTPFQGHTTPAISSIWRGPTPPWTQYSPRQKSLSVSLDH
jgi:hypothetical protein